MNCKQGDLAYVYRTRCPESEGMLGITVVCQKHLNIEGEDIWTVPPFKFGAWTIHALSDAILKPIRGEPIPDEVTDTKIVDEESMTIPA